MKLYHYLPREYQSLSQGILSVSRIPEELLKYSKHAGSCDFSSIIEWLENTFPGRSKSVSVLTEQVQWQGNDPMLKQWVDTRVLAEIDADNLMSDGLIEAIYCKECSDQFGNNEIFHKIAYDEIDTSPLPWHLCSAEQGLFFGVIRHYFLVLKDGFISNKYIKITKE